MCKSGKTLVILSISLVLNGLFTFKTYSITPEQLDSVIDVAEYQYKNMIIQVGDTTKYPRSSERMAVETWDWTSGFFPGSMWYLYELTEDTFWRNNAARWTHAIEKETEIDWTHDLGFMFYCSFGNGYRLVETPGYKDIMIDAANTLAGRYVPTVGITDSWSWIPWDTKTEAIIDNMMNLELLYWATSVTGDSSYYDIATTHSQTTMANHFRSDYSSYHVVEYNPTTGAATSKHTHQGYADESAWARGQGWGVYGYTYVFRETGDSTFLHQADSIAHYILNHPNLPADLVPYWDYDDPAIPNTPRDASAAALVSSALFELSQYSEHGDWYYAKAVQMLESLMSNSYLAARDANNDFILMHSTGHKPANSEIDVPINYADYYFLEAIIRYKNLSSINVKPVISQIEDLNVTPNKTTEVIISVSDANYTDTITIKSVDKPDFASFVQVNNTKATLTLIPDNTKIGQQYSIKIAATDQNGAADTMIFNITVKYDYKDNLEVTASTHDGNIPENTLDEDLNTRWSAEGSGQWILFDMKEIGGTLTNALFAFYKGNERQSIFKLEVSNDTTKGWTEIFNGQSSGTTLALESFYDDTIRTRYVRYTGYGNTASPPADVWNSITEANFNYSPNNIPIGDSITATETGALTYLFQAHGFTDLDKDSFNYIWNFGDGAIDTTIYDTITHVYALMGKKVFSVTTIDTFGGTYNITDSIYTGNSAPVGDSIQITKITRTKYLFEAKGVTDPDGHEISYTWNFGGGNIFITDTNSIYYTFSTPGKYIVALDAEDAYDGKLTMVDSVTIVNNAPVSGSVAVTETGRTEVKLKAVGFTDADGDKLTYAWDLGNGNTVTTDKDSLVYDYKAIGVFDISVTVNDIFGAEASSAGMVTIVNSAPISGSLTVIETGRTEVKLQVSGITDADGDEITYTWDLGNDSTVITIEDSLVFDYDAIGMFNVSVKASDEFGGESVTNGSVNIVNNAPSGDSIEVAKTGRTTYLFTASGFSDVDGDEFTYFWDFGDGKEILSSGDTVSHTFTALGKYIITLTATDIFNAESQIMDTVTIINQAPVAGSMSIVTEFGGICNFEVNGVSDPESDSITYLWDFGDGSSTETDSGKVSHTYTSTGNFNYKLKIVDVFGDSLVLSGTVKIDDQGGIDNISINELKIYPVPTVNELNIVLPEKLNQVNLTMSVTDITGSIVLVQEQESISGKVVFDVTSLRKGIYLYTISSSGNSYIGKFIKK